MIASHRKYFSVCEDKKKTNKNKQTLANKKEKPKQPGKIWPGICETKMKRFDESE